MLDTVFLKILDMSLAASLAIAVILLARLCLKRAPKVISYALWAVVLFRLLCPVTVESAVSIMPEKELVSQEYDMSVEPFSVLSSTEEATQLAGEALKDVVDTQYVQTVEGDPIEQSNHVPASPKEIILMIGSYVWLAGIAVMLIRATVQTVRLRRRLVGAVPMERGVFLADHIDSPFVMGLIRPKIYLPSSLDVHEREYILLHERHHIRRGDHITRALGFVALCLHWFNPFAWAAFILSGRDMEMSCDEAVVRRLGGEIRADYAASLLRLTTGRRAIAPTPLAFGEGNTGGRIRNLSKWKKPLLIVVVIAVVVCVVLAVCLLTDPITEKQEVLAGGIYRTESLLYPEQLVLYDAIAAWEYNRYVSEIEEICITADMQLYLSFEDGSEGFLHFGALEPYEMSERMAELVGEKVTDAYILRFDIGEHSLLREGDFLLFMQAASGKTLYAFGWEDVSERDDVYSDESVLYALFTLETVMTEEQQDLIRFFARSLIHSMEQPYACLNVFDFVEVPGYTIIGFAGSLSDPEHMTDMGYAVLKTYRYREGYRLLDWHVYPNAVTTGVGIHMAEPAVLSESGKMTDRNTYDIILSANEELGKIVRYGDDPHEGVVSVIDSEFSMTVFSWKDFAKDKTVSTVFYNKDGERMVVDMPERVSVTKIVDNYNRGTVALDENFARHLLNHMENAPFVELTHPVYGHGTTFRSGYVIRVEYVIHDEYVLHDDMVDCFLWEYNGEYFLDGYQDPEDGKHIQQIEGEWYRMLHESVNSLIRWQTSDIDSYLSTYEEPLTVIPEAMILERYLYGTCTESVTVTDTETVTWLAYALQSPQYVRGDTDRRRYDALENKDHNGVRIRYIYEDGANGAFVECWVFVYEGSYYKGGYGYADESKTDWIGKGIDIHVSVWNKLMEQFK